MIDPTDLLKSSLDVGRDWLCSPQASTNPDTQTRSSGSLVPIRSLGANHRDRILRHLLALDAGDRYLRFGYAAQDAQVQRYVQSLDFDRDEIFGIYNRKLELIAVAHLAYPCDPGFESCAEFGVSVLPSARGRGYGARLFDRAAMHAANDGIRMLFIHALTENDAMLRIARNAGAVVQQDGTESEAYLQLPASTLDSQVKEMIEEHVAQTDYLIKVQAKQFWSFLDNLQRLRRDLIDTPERLSD